MGGIRGQRRLLHLDGRRANDAAGVLPGEKLIYAEPTTTTGSIGVIMPHYNVEGLMKEWKIENDSVKSHPLKDLGSITRKMSDDERKLLQNYIDDSFARFKEVVHFGRKSLKKDEIDECATGVIFTTNQALEKRLVDAEGYLTDAVKQAIKLAKLGEDDVRVVKYEPPVTLLTVLNRPNRRPPGPRHGPGRAVGPVHAASVLPLLVAAVGDDAW